ncbi:hypothetical protein Cba03nite_47550 [Catellatospora bangladeshensis]|uniref:Uncharacterized protein n=1 Tax=Catellatospora bangladeshensis TaxID=310355 RepID=A0A8J3JF67_9ACTN|nr:hypothetical protein Cba03nite_47550 [Catellatospora bangladeshensis]
MHLSFTNVDDSRRCYGRGSRRRVGEITCLVPKATTGRLPGRGAALRQALGTGYWYDTNTGDGSTAKVCFGENVGLSSS